MVQAGARRPLAVLTVRARLAAAVVVALALGLAACDGDMDAYFARDVVETDADIGYVDGSDDPRQRLDVYRPRAVRGWPVVVFVHGGYWVAQDKRYFSPIVGLYGNVGRALARRGIGVVIPSYRLVPGVTFDDELSDVLAAVRWTIAHVAEHGGDPRFVVVGGGSAGGHLALLAAYTPNDRALQPDASAADTHVAGVVSFYGPTDFQEVYEQTEEMRRRLARRRQRVRPYGALLEGMIQWAGLSPASGQTHNYIADLLGADPSQDPELYSRLSPLGRVGPHCPPTLLLQGTADIFGMGPSVRRLHQALTAAGAPSVLVEFPGADHAFDLALPQLSPAAQAAVYDVERFLALL